MRHAALLVILTLAACSPAATPDEPPPEPTGTVAESEPTTDPATEPSDAEPAEDTSPASPPEVEGEWVEADTGPMTSDGAIEEADLPDGIKSYLRDALMEGIVDNQEWAEEFPDCPVEARITALHPAGFAVGSVLGCGPDGPLGVFAERDGVWHEAVMAAPEEPQCAELAEWGVPAGVPVTWDEGLRCVEGEGWRYW